MKYRLVGCDTDSIKFCRPDGLPMSEEEMDQILKKMNDATPEGIVLEKDGFYEQFLVVKSKNYVTCKNGKKELKGSSLTDQKKEPALLEFLEKCINAIMDKNPDKVQDLYIEYIKEALNPKDIRRWCTKRTITKPIMECKGSETSRANEVKPYNACMEAIAHGVIPSIQEGDKIYVYQVLDGQKPKVVKGEIIRKKDGTASMVDNTLYRFPELYKGDHDKYHYVKRVYMTLNILQNVLDMKKFIKYHNKGNRKLLDAYL